MTDDADAEQMTMGPDSTSTSWIPILSYIILYYPILSYIILYYPIYYPILSYVFNTYSSNPYCRSAPPSPCTWNKLSNAIECVLRRTLGRQPLLQISSPSPCTWNKLGLSCKQKRFYHFFIICFYPPKAQVKKKR